MNWIKNFAFALFMTVSMAVSCVFRLENVHKIIIINLGISSDPEA